MKGAKMAYSKIYTRVSWVNEPSTATPLNDNNLNNMDATIDILDSRIVNIDGRVEQLAGYEPRVIEYATQAENSKKDSEAYAIGKRDGVDVISGDPAYHNNSKYYSELAGTSATNAATSETNAGTSESNAATSASNAEAYAVGQRNGSDVPSTDPTYHNNAKYYSEQASTDATSADASATSASGSASDAEAYAVGKRGGTDVPSTDPAYENNSKYYSEQAGTSATSAIQSASDADSRAEDSEAYAIGKRNGVDVTSGDPAYHNNSKYYSELAGVSETNAALSEANASTSELNAADSESDAGAWAIGERDGQPVPSTDPTYHNNAKYWAEQASQAAGGGVTSFNGRSGVVDPTKGDYNIGQISPTTGARKGQIPSVDVNGDFVLTDKLQSLTGTLLSSGWTLSTDVYTQSVTFSGVSADTVGVVGLALNITEEAREAASAISLRLRSQGTNTLTFQATDIPDQNIPVVLNI